MNGTEQAVGTNAVLLIVYVSLALGISFLCSILEAALLSVRDIDLARRADDGDGAAKRLLAIKRERVDDAISAVLTLNTIAHTVGATLAGAQAAVVFGDAWIGVFSGVLTLLVLVVTEIIPKTLGTVNASRLVGFVGSSLTFLMVALKPILRVTRMLTRMFTSHGHEQKVSRRDVLALVAIAKRQGALEEDVSATLSNVLKLDEVKVTDVMTPRTVVRMLPIDATAQTLLDSKEHASFSRIPLYRDSRDHVEGYVLVRDVLSDAARSGDTSAKLADYVRPMTTVEDGMALGDVLDRLVDSREHIAVVVDQFGGMEGIVTLEDAVETMIGREIVDELDTVVDLRKLAVELRDRRTRRQGVAPGARLEV